MPMKISSSGRELKVNLEWQDINSLKKGETVAERYNGEHKFNLSCTSESLEKPDWTETHYYPFKAEFNQEIHDFFVQLPVFDIRNQFIAYTTVPLCKNPYFDVVRIVYPN
jgi:hypothetical protein